MPTSDRIHGAPKETEPQLSAERIRDADTRDGNNRDGDKQDKHRDQETEKGTVATEIRDSPQRIAETAGLDEAGYGKGSSKGMEARAKVKS